MATRFEHPTTGRINQAGVPDLIEEICGFMEDLAFRWGMVERGIFIHPMALKGSHVSAAHTEEDVERTLEAAEEVLKGMAKG